jgi:hypothetical protein
VPDSWFVLTDASEAPDYELGFALVYRCSGGSIDRLSLEGKKSPIRAGSSGAPTA